MGKRVVITGAAEFLGSHLCDRFLNTSAPRMSLTDGVLIPTFSGQFIRRENLIGEQLWAREHNDLAKHIRK